VQAKTEAATAGALTAAGLKADKEILHVDKSVGMGVQQMRKVLWFEKFDWCVSSGTHVYPEMAKTSCSQMFLQRGC
jgi:hypothetical protein